VRLAAGRLTADGVLLVVGEADSELLLPQALSNAAESANVQARPAVLSLGRVMRLTAAPKPAMVTTPEGTSPIGVGRDAAAPRRQAGGRFNRMVVLALEEMNANAQTDGALRLERDSEGEILQLSEIYAVVNFFSMSFVQKWGEVHVLPTAAPDASGAILPFASTSRMFAVRLQGDGDRVAPATQRRIRRPAAHPPRRAKHGSIDEA
jgi:hypothetical protein